MSTDHFDVLIVGAGISGIAAAYRLKEKCPGKSFAILESREAIGGTWDLFRFPGIRSDSDMFTLCYPFHPWPESRLIVDGTAIREYVQGVAAEYGIDRQVHFNRRVVRAAWSSDDARWTVDIIRGETGETEQMTCDFLFACSGYFRYDEAYTPDFPGVDRFGGQIVHPQFWSEDIDHAGKRVVVVGSGATALTIVPAMAESAGHVTMLQRSPSYVISMPAVDPMLKLLGRVVPWELAYRVVRWRNVKFMTGVWVLSKRFPALVRRVVRALAKRKLPPGYDLDMHFNPRYDPWDERPCVVPDDDFFEAIKSGRVDVVTDRIETFTEKGIALASGAELEADMIVTATGLRLQAVGGIALTVDGDEVDVSKTFAYRGAMLSGVPNMAYAFGYVNQSWTLGADISCQRVCSLLNHMDARGYDICTPRTPPAGAEELPFWELSSGYVRRDGGLMPRQALGGPWYRSQSYTRDRRELMRSPVEGDALEFARVKAAAPAPGAAEVAA